MYRRTAAEIADSGLAWARPDRALFAAGACHVLALRMIERFPDLGFSVHYMRPTNSDRGHHLFASDGITAFDFNGYSEAQLLRAVNIAALRSEQPNWQGRFEALDLDLPSFCTRFSHRLPAQFPGDVIRRADRYIDQLTATSSG